MNHAEKGFYIGPWGAAGVTVGVCGFFMIPNLYMIFGMRITTFLFHLHFVWICLAILSGGIALAFHLHEYRWWILTRIILLPIIFCVFERVFQYPSSIIRYFLSITHIHQRLGLIYTILGVFPWSLVILLSFLLFPCRSVCQTKVSAERIPLINHTRPKCTYWWFLISYSALFLFIAYLSYWISSLQRFSSWPREWFIYRNLSYFVLYAIAAYMITHRIHWSVWERQGKAEGLPITDVKEAPVPE